MTSNSKPLWAKALITLLWLKTLSSSLEGIRRGQISSQSQAITDKELKDSSENLAISGAITLIDKSIESIEFSEATVI